MTMKNTLRLTSLASCAGCAAKMGPGSLSEVLHPLSLFSGSHPRLLVGFDTSDDAAVYQINDEQAVISTTDFFPPLVDDPRSFGAIAAANALSDVYAMGGTPLMALNLVAWPETLDTSVLGAVLQGGAEVVAQAGAVIAGGHTVMSQEPKYGLAVTGLVHPQRIFTKLGARPGDVLVLSKPLGTGLLTTAAKRDLVEPAELDAAIQSMMTLNKAACEALCSLGEAVHAVTDVTGFGLLGHALEMARQSDVRFHFDISALPLLTGALTAASRGAIPGGSRRNEAYLAPKTLLSTSLTAEQRALLFDPQTSGGLLAALDPGSLAALHAFPGVQFWPIGEVTALPAPDALSLEV